MNKIKIFFVLFFLCLLTGKPFILKGENIYLRFRHLTQENGLKNSSVHAITQDKHGFIWIGTEDGLFRYDGFRFNVFKSNPNDTNSLNSNVIFSLLAASDGKIWVGTYNGLMVYDESTNRFTDMDLSKKYKQDQPVPVDDIISTSENEIWIVCQGIGILIYDKTTNAFND